MEKLNDTELLAINGGGIGSRILFGIGCFSVMVIGFLDGFFRSKVCRR